MTFAARWPRLGRVNGLHVILPNKFDHFRLSNSFACHLRGEDRQWKQWTCQHRLIIGNSEVDREAVVSATQIWPHLADQRGLSTAITAREFSNGCANRGGKAQWRLQMPQAKGLSTQPAECSQPDAAPSNCGLSYSKFVRKCSDWLTDRQLERVAVRLKAYKALKKAPRAHNKLAVIRDIGKIVPSKCLTLTFKHFSQFVLLPALQTAYLRRCSCCCRRKQAAQQWAARVATSLLCVFLQKSIKQSSLNFSQKALTS